MSVLTELRRRLERLWRRQMALKELQDIGLAGQDVIARDVGIAPYQLGRLAASGRRDTDALTRLLAALRLKRATIEREQPEVARDLELVCAECGSERRCLKDLDAWRSPREFHKYCPNVATIAALLERKGIHTIPAKRPAERRRPF
jgi:hypothetical protein